MKFDKVIMAKPPCEQLHSAEVDLQSGAIAECARPPSGAITKRASPQQNCVQNPSRAQSLSVQDPRRAQSLSVQVLIWVQSFVDISISFGTSRAQSLSVHVPRLSRK